MDFQQLIARAKEIREVNSKLASNDGCKAWSSAERMQGFMGDVGDLAKLVMAKNCYRKYDDLDKKLAHELGDCLWSVIILADELGVDLEKSFLETMNEIEARLK
ncbi:MAG: MazG nucleotide pyrophosphohydrolase domain-containing protein [Patescibacteria group bacterium]|nr:MazG nucleotide pyrophosphohydrolase domain-containing protein [Patescibacteria group bacterium]